MYAIISSWGEDAVMICNFDHPPFLELPANFVRELINAIQNGVRMIVAQHVAIFIAQAWRTLASTMSVHMINESTHKISCEIGSQMWRPYWVRQNKWLVLGKSMGVASRVKSTLPSNVGFNPVAVIIISASNTYPEVNINRTPCSVKESMWSVTIDALPELMVSNRSPSGTRHKRCSQGV